MTGLDDLLRYEDEPAPVRRKRRSGWLVRSLAISIVLTALVWVGLRLAGLGVSVVLIFTLLFALAVLRRALASVRYAPPRPGQVPGGAARREDAHVPDGVYAASGRWDTRLTAAERDAARFATIVLPQVTELVDERLRLRHGITAHEQPEQARALMGERLWRLRYERVDRTPAPREIAAIVTEIESL